jgi:predicted ABC-type ATPase
MKHLYIISGCNGAGKTTASYTILPEILNCREFVNADEIARGLSPFNPESAGIQAGRLMLERIQYLLKQGKNFAIETTLSTRSYKQLVSKAQEQDYYVTLLFLYLPSPQMAVERVKVRVAEGGHNIPTDVIVRRYEKGLSNFFNLYREIVDEWMLIENSGEAYQILAIGNKIEIEIVEESTYNAIRNGYEKQQISK